MRIVTRFLSAFSVALGTACGLAAPGDLDTSYGIEGKRFAGMNSGGGNGGQAVALQPDGKAVVCGYINMGGLNFDGGIARFTANGALDTTFGGTGKVAVMFGPRDDIFNAVAVQSDGKIVATGRWFNGTTSGHFDSITARLLPDGNLDTSFGGTGKIITSLSAGDDSTGAIAIQADGRIVVGGRVDVSGNGDFVLARYLADGSLDTSFGGTGKVVTARGLDQRINGLALQNDGKIVAAGPDGTSSLFSFLVARYLPNGSLDSSFGSGGLVSTFLGSSDYPTCVAVQADGKILVSAWSSNGSNWDFAVVRFLTTGVRDSTFGSAGVVRLNLGSPQDYGISIAIQPDGYVLLAGYVSNATNDGVGLVRLDPGGNLDPTFGDGGKVAAFPTSGSERARGVVVQADGKIVIALDSPGAGVARYLGGVAAPFENWKLSQLGNIHAPDLGNSDGDELVNLVEYALLLSPIAPSQPPGVDVFAYADGQRLRMFVPRDPTRNDITVSIEATSDLGFGPWTPLATSTLGALFSGPGYVAGDDVTPGVKTVEVRDIVNIADAAQRWMRVKVTH